MNKQEQARYAANFLARRTSRIVSAQNGYNDVMTQFADGYTHDTLEDVNTDNGAPETTTRTDSVGDSNWNGTVPGGSNEDSPIYGAIDILQQHIASLGDDSLLAKWASTADALRKTVTSGMAQAKPNTDGVTEGVRHVSDNTNSQTPGSHGYIDVTDLESAARKLTTLSARIVVGAGDKL